jgi:uncharacterized cupin superfamily protein
MSTAPGSTRTDAAPREPRLGGIGIKRQNRREVGARLRARSPPDEALSPGGRPFRWQPRHRQQTRDSTDRVISMIIRKATARSKVRDEPNFGSMTTESFSDTAGISQYGAYLQTLQPGAKSSMRHWHEKEDEFLFVVSGQVTVVENDGPHVLAPGDAACWPAGVQNAHHVLNESSQPCSYLMVGTRLTHDVCHYPDAGKTLYTEGEEWRLEDASGHVLRSGKLEPEW